jgi:glycine/D-amino acid oxidase-like deaminating enzyme
VGLESTYSHYALPHERIDTTEASKRYPALRLPDDHAVFVDLAGGYLHVERSVGLFQNQARGRGADLRYGIAVDGWSADEAGVTVRCGGEMIRAAKLIVTAGAWGAPLLAELGAAVRIDARVQVWVRPDKADGLGTGECPIYFAVTPDGVFYGCPMIDGETMKIAEHGMPHPLPDADALQGYAVDSDAAACIGAIHRLFPGRTFQKVRTSRCMYTMTPDEHFVIDRHPERSNVVLGLGFSGHGFKFAPAVGEALAELALEGQARCPLDLFQATRFAMQ